jgi:hypothetical protein
MEPIPLTTADRENIEAVNVMLALARMRQAHKREPFYKAAGQHLERLRHDKPVEIWAELVRKHIGIGLARAYELTAIGAGRLSLAELRAQKGAADRRWKAENLPKKTVSAAKSEA